MNDDTFNQTCDCGNDTYHVKVTEDRQAVWAACTDCGRPTAVLGDGMEKQRQWYARQDSTDINIPVKGEKNVQVHHVCGECGESIEGGVMIPEDEGPMHTDCWTEWMKDNDA